MKIAFFVSDASLRAGTERAVDEAAKALSGHHEVSVVSMALTRGGPAYDYDVTVIDRRAKSPFPNSKQVRKAQQQFYDHQVIATSPAMLPQCNDGVIFWGHRTIPDISARIRSRIESNLTKIRFGVALNRRTQQWFEQRNVPTRTINNIVGDEFYRAGNRGDGIMWMGRISPEKQIDYLLYIADNLPSKNFYVVGEGKESHKLRGYDNVHHLGSLENPQDTFAKSRFLLLTSMHESWSYSVAEAQAMGVHPVSFDLDGPRQLITTPETGTLVDKGDWIGMMEAVNEVVPNPAALREHAQQYRSSVVVRDWLELLSI